MAETMMIGRRSTLTKVNRTLCILCKTLTVARGTLVVNPRNDSFQNLLDCVEERSTIAIES